jgi:hypothetical protein
VPVSHSCLSLLISKSMFKGVSWCIPSLSILYFGQFNPFHCSSLSLPFHPPFFSSFQYMSLYHVPSQMLCIMIYCWHFIISFTFPSFPEFHSVVPLLQTCSLYTFVYGTWSCLVFYMFILCLYLPHMRENTWPLSFWTWLISLNIMSSNCIHLASNHMVSFFFMAD